MPLPQTMWKVYVLFLCLQGINGTLVSDSVSRVSNKLLYKHICDGGPCAQALADISAFPGDEKYREGALVFNPVHSKTLPAFISFPKSIKDLQRCLKCAYENLVPFTVKSGGHSCAGYSTIDGSNNGAFVIHLGEMNEVVVDEGSETVWVQAGARWRDVYGKVDDSKYLVVGGICPTVGVSGFTLGGGYSLLSRYLGLATDSVLSFTMVTANGSSVVVTNATNNTDLYWALRGGGGGNFGVVLDFTFRLHPMFNSTPYTYTYGTMMFDSSKAELLANIFDSVSTMRCLCIHAVILPGWKIQLHFFLIRNLPECDYTNVFHVLRLFSQIAQDQESDVSLKNYTSYLEIVKDIGNELNIRMAVSPHSLVLRGCILNDIPLTKLKQLKLELEIPETCVIVINHLGGAVRDISPTETAYFRRNGEFDYYSPCVYRNKTEKRKVREFESVLLHELKSSRHCVGSYVNDIDRELRNWQREYYGGNYQRLVEIKEQWNPLNQGTFHFLQEIGSDYNP